MLNIMHHRCLVSYWRTLYIIGVNESISVQKLVGNFNTMAVANSGRQHHRSLDSYFKSS